MLGAELVRVFGGDKNYEVFAWDFDDIDIGNEPQAEKKVNGLAPGVIINAAAYNAVDKCEEPAEFEIAKKVNGLAPGYLAKAAKNIDATFIHYSSDYVFDGAKKEGYQEDDKPCSISKYGKTKLTGEELVKNIGGKFYIVRLQKLFGRSAAEVALPSGKRSQGDGITISAGTALSEGRRNVGSGKKSFFETMLSLAETKKEFDMVDEESGNFTYAPDLAGRTKFLIESGLPFGVYHITNEGAPVTWFGAAKILFEMASKDVKLNPVPADKFPRPAKRPKYSVLLNTKLPPLRPWPEALREFLGKI